jgi:chromosome segregation protein
MVDDVAGAESLLDSAGPDGGSALLQVAHGASSERAPSAADGASMPAGAQRLLDLVSGPAEVVALAARLLADAWVVERLEQVPSDFAGIAVTRAGRVWFAAWGEVRQLSEGGTERVLARRNERDRLIVATEQAAQGEQAAKHACDTALAETQSLEEARGGAERALRECERRQTEAAEAVRRTEWLIEQRRAAPAEGPLAVRKAELEGQLASERAQAERLAREAEQRRARIERLRAQLVADRELVPRAERLAAAVGFAAETVQARYAALEQELAADRLAGEQMASELRACAAQEAELQAALRAAGETVTAAEVAAQRLRDQAGDAELELKTVAERLGLSAAGAAQAVAEGAQPPSEVEQPTAAALTAAAADERAADAEPATRLDEEEIASLRSRVERLSRRREQLGPVNPLAQEEYAEAVAHVEEMEGRRADLETALRELRGVIRDTDRQIQETFEETFEAAARNFEELVGDVFPGGSGRLRLVAEEQPPRPVLGGQSLTAGAKSGETQLVGGASADEDSDAVAEAAAEAEAEREQQLEEDSSEIGQLGVEIEITPAGKSSKRLSLLSGGEKSMTALAFLFAVFLARPCPFYILDEVEAALDDLNLDRFLALLRRYADRAQFIVITHQKRTMEAADYLFGVSMGGDGVSKVLSRRLPSEQAQTPEVAEVA